MSTKLKITLNKIQVIDNGESPGKGELKWSFAVDDENDVFSERTNTLKVGDGDTINIGESCVKSKNTNDNLVLLGTVTEADSFLKGGDDVVALKKTYTSANNWGIGTHEVPLSDGKHLDVKVYYTIAEA